MNKSKYLVGDIFINKYGDEYEIVEKLEKDRRKIKFKNSGFEKIITTQTIFAKGVIDDSNSMYSVGKQFTNTHGCKFIITEIINSSRRKIKFLDKYEYETVVSTGNILLGTIKNPYNINVYSVGCVGEFQPSKNPNSGNKLYETWRGMIRRCYYGIDYYRNDSYKNTMMCDEWLNFSNFHKWAIDNYIEGFVLDKDLMQIFSENKIYSPETCIFIPKELNGFLVDKFKQKTPYFRKGKYEVRVTEFNSHKSKALGCYSNLEDARKDILNFEIRQMILAIDYLLDLELYSIDIINTLLCIKNDIKLLTEQEV